MRPSAKYQVLFTGAFDRDGDTVGEGPPGPTVGPGCPGGTPVTILANLLANSSATKTLLLLSTARPSCGWALPFGRDIIENVLVPGTKEPTRPLSESSNQTVPALSTPIPEICVA